jgi:hypothetical protein
MWVPTADALPLNWPVAAHAASNGHTQSGLGPTTPTGVTSACVGLTTPKVTVTWASVLHATTYTIYEATTSATGTYTAIATGVTASPWTSGTFTLGTYWFEVSANIGTAWTSPNSPATAQRTIAVIACT